MPFDDEPEDRTTLGEAMLVTVCCLIVTPGLIWWANTLFTIIRDMLEALL